jgi:uncharacterized protein (DUF305 family)
VLSAGRPHAGAFFPEFRLVQNRRLVTALCVAVPFAFGCIAGRPAAAQQMQHQMDSMDNPADKAFLGAMRDMMMGMHKSMPTGDTDVDFVRMMLPHHQAAVDMAKAELQYGKDADLKVLATDIVAAQDREIAMMKAWLEKHAK